MEMNILDHWDLLSPATRQGLTDNPGCRILPRTMTGIRWPPEGRSRTEFVEAFHTANT